MSFSTPPHDRRRFLSMAAGFSLTALLSGCGSGSAEASDPVTVVAARATSATTAAIPAASTPAPLNLALNLSYLGAQYHGFAARGAGLPATMTGGSGQAGAVTGARQASLADPLVVALAAELADEKLAHVAALRGQLGALAAAQPALDLSTASTGAFSTAAQGAGIVAAGATFDPYSGDTNFLLGGFFIENGVSATYRTLLAQTSDAATSALLASNLADAIYHGGLIRSVLEDRAAADPSIAAALTNAGRLLAGIDGTDTGDQSLAGAIGASSNLLDADGRPIPFTRTGQQVLRTIYLSSGSAGGFMPAGANGVS